MAKLKQFAVDLFNINAIKFGEYKTKVGLMTPVYCDLRVLVSYPQVLATTSDLLMSLIQKSNVDVICGVPYTALPIATIVSHKTDIPMVMRRKEPKDYGTKKLIEGTINIGDKCLIIEDVVTSGSSILETTKDLQEEGLKVTDAVVLLNREQGGESFLLQNGIKIHALLTMSQLMIYLKESNCVNDEVYAKVMDYIQNTKVQSLERPPRTKLSFEKRLQHANNSMTKKLMEIMIEKQSTLCLAADLSGAHEIVNLASKVGPYICMLKLHCDIVEDFTEDFVQSLKQLATDHNFLLFEDRKFADIGKTSQLQFTKGVFNVSTWAHLVTAHSLTGNGFLEFLRDAQQDVGVFLLAQCSAKGSLIDDKYVKATIKLGSDYKDVVSGFVAQNADISDLGFLQLTPGVNMLDKGDNLGQQYNTPEKVVENGCDVAVVGRGITQAKNPALEAQKYQKVLWDLYLKRIE